MKILYLHGFASSPDYKSEKIKALNSLGEVYCPHICYENGYDNVIDYLENEILASKPDVIVGTSMGGLMSAILGTYYGVPFVSLNPVLDPITSLKKYIGIKEKYNGDPIIFTENELDSYASVSFPYKNSSVGCVLLAKDDEVIDYHKSLNKIESANNNMIKICISTIGGHRFSNNEMMIDAVKEVESRSLGYNDCV